MPMSIKTTAFNKRHKNKKNKQQINKQKTSGVYAVWFICLKTTILIKKQTNKPMDIAGTDAQRVEWQRDAVSAWVKTYQLYHLNTHSLVRGPYPFRYTFSKKSQKVTFKDWNSISPRGKRNKPKGESTNKGLLSIIYKEQLQVNKKRTEEPTKQGKIFESILIKRNSKSQETEKNMALTSLSHWKNENSQHTSILLSIGFKKSLGEDLKQMGHRGCCWEGKRAQAVCKALQHCLGKLTGRLPKFCTQVCALREHMLTH